ncbi:hypothetical protein DY000_02029786 [Brassica cretica]|uniref:Tudor domain-containing protein n=1 Tax=Brassica cretica TaxID=69181 RepID=A0ABQ7DJT3_BRACR|nr:hypothetical protein DY000_02029786 [Brassica cretica]
MASPSAVSEDWKSDDLKIFSVGVLYSGYWSSSRVKDRFPYPVGYKTVRAHNGSTYYMEIEEGAKGPLFLNGAESYSIDSDTSDTSLSASSEVTAPDEPIEIPPVRVYVPKVPYPILPKHLMDPICAEQLAGFRKMVRRLPQNISFEHVWEIRPLHMFFKNCRESQEEIKALFTEALTPSLKVLPKVDDPGNVNLVSRAIVDELNIVDIEPSQVVPTISQIRYASCISVVSGEQLEIVPKKELGKKSEIKEVLDGDPHTDTKKLMTLAVAKDTHVDLEYPEISHLIL